MCIVNFFSLNFYEAATHSFRSDIIYEITYVHLVKSDFKIFRNSLRFKAFV